MIFVSVDRHAFAVSAPRLSCETTMSPPRKIIFPTPTAPDPRTPPEKSLSLAAPLVALRKKSWKIFFGGNDHFGIYSENHRLNAQWNFLKTFHRRDTGPAIRKSAQKSEKMAKNPKVANTPPFGRKKFFLRFWAAFTPTNQYIWIFQKFFFLGGGGGGGGQKR